MSNPFGFVDVCYHVNGGAWWLVGFNNDRCYQSPNNKAIWLGGRERFRFHATKD